jgi:hypothetical protein
MVAAETADQTFARIPCINDPLVIRKIRNHLNSKDETRESRALADSRLPSVGPVQATIPENQWFNSRRWPMQVVDIRYADSLE